MDELVERKASGEALLSNVNRSNGANNRGRQGEGPGWVQAGAGINILPPIDHQQNTQINLHMYFEHP